MLLAIARFELRQRLRSLSTWVYFVMFFGFAYLMMIAAGGAFKSVAVTAGDRVHANAPATLYDLITVLSYFGLIIIGAVAGGACQRDIREGIHPLLYTKPVRERDYLLGRLLGALTTLVLIFSSIGLGTWTGTRMPFVVRTLFGENHLAAYLNPYAIGVLPNLVITGILFFSLATLSRKMLPVYTASVVLLIGYLIAASLTAKLEHKTVASLLDPFGLIASDHLTEYWSIAEKNTRTVPWSGVLLWNRLIWLGLAVGLLGFTLRRFRFAHPSTGGGQVQVEPAGAQPLPIPPHASSSPRHAASAFTMWRRLSWLDFRETVKNIYFAVIVLAGVLFMIAAAYNLGSLYGTNTHPVTYKMIDLVAGSFDLFVLIILVFYSGELVWRERDAGIADLIDATGLPGWVPLGAKLTALFGVLALLMIVEMVTSVIVQAVSGYFHPELGLYLKYLLGIKLFPFLLTGVLAFALQALVNHKYLGYFAMVAYYLSQGLAGRFNFNHHLYRYASAPGVVYSDMNGFGPFLRPLLGFDAYWAAVALLLALGTRLLWVRGHEARMKHRLQQAFARLQASPATGVLGATAFLLAAGLGGWLYYNTNHINRYRTTFEAEAEAADYERRYRTLKDIAQPRIVAIRFEIDLHPEAAQPWLHTHGELRLRNKTSAPISTVYVNLPSGSDVHIGHLQVGAAATPAEADTQLGFYRFVLPAALAPGSETTLSFAMEYVPRGIRNDAPPTFIAHNGTFLNSGLFPHLGYQRDTELADDDDRRRHGLGPRERLPDVADVKARQNNLISSDADWIDIDGTVSTAADQTAIIPGKLVRSWEEAGRRYFHYQSERPELSFFSVLSARYQIVRDSHQGVAIEIYHHPGHAYNVRRMIESIKASLDYFTSQFSPYQHHQVRIVEFPRYQSFAQSFPGTIPYSESVGFIAKVDPKDPDDVDYPYYITAHEVAHQWWAHQVIGGNVQGVTLLDETLAQYSALMVMKKTFGDTQMRRFLRYELDRYLSGRSRERKKELPLYRVENQPYIHYNKGSLVMYALQDHLGEATVNRCLADYLRQYAFQEPPYTNSLELLALLRAATPPDLQYLITDLFETITLYDLRTTSARARPLGSGKYEVTLDVTAAKLRADELGKEQEVPITAEPIEIGVQDKAGKFLYLAKHPLSGKQAHYTVTVAGTPAKAGIDPQNKLIDRKPDDNVVTVELSGSI